MNYFRVLFHKQEKNFIADMRPHSFGQVVIQSPSNPL